eukprot:5434043-Prymnesium_polylepis.1
MARRLLVTCALATLVFGDWTLESSRRKFIRPRATFASQKRAVHMIKRSAVSSTALKRSNLDAICPVLASSGRIWRLARAPEGGSAPALAPRAVGLGRSARGRGSTAAALCTAISVRGHAAYSFSSQYQSHGLRGPQGHRAG